MRPIIIFIVTFFCYPWTCPKVVQDVIVLVYAGLLYENCRVFQNIIKTKFFVELKIRL